MDRVRTRSQASRIRPVLIVVTIGLVLAGGGATLAKIDFSSRRVDRDKISIATVQKGTMEIKVSANGRLVSRNIEQLAAEVSGRVAKADIKPGAVVHAGEVLVELTNPRLIDAAEEAQSAWDGAKADLEASDAELQNEVVNQEVLLTQAQLDLEKAELKVETDRKLSAENLIANIDAKRSELDVVQLRKISALRKARIQRLRDNIQPQLGVKRARVSQLARELARTKTQVADLKIVAGINGIVQAIDVVVGQQVQVSTSIGRIAQLDKLYAELKVAAREAPQVQVGQRAVIDTRNGTVNGLVSRVDPGVIDGTVTADVTLEGALPAGSRPQLQVEGTIYISQLPDTLFVGKPSYVKNDAAITVYKLDPDGRYATRATIQVGKLSLNHLQVLRGLQAGDRIITSEIGEWQDQERVLLK